MGVFFHFKQEKEFASVITRRVINTP